MLRGARVSVLDIAIAIIASFAMLTVPSTLIASRCSADWPSLTERAELAEDAVEANARSCVAPLDTPPIVARQDERPREATGEAPGWVRRAPSIVARHERVDALPGLRPSVPVLAAQRAHARVMVYRN